jgi:hypothetical protein
MILPDDYRIFQQFTDTPISRGFTGIRRSDPILLEMEELMRNRKQFFYIGDLIHILILFALPVASKKQSYTRLHYSNRILTGR